MTHKLTKIGVSFFIFLTAIFSVTSCGVKEEPEPDLIPAESVSENIQNTFGKLASGKYPNLRGTLENTYTHSGQIYPILVYRTEWYETSEQFQEAVLQEFRSVQPDLDPQYVSFVPRTEANSPKPGYEDNLYMFGMYEPADMRYTMQMVATRQSTWINHGKIAELSDSVSFFPCVEAYEGNFYELRNRKEYGDIPALSNGLTFQEAQEALGKEINQNYYFDNANPDLTYQDYSVQVCQLNKSDTAYRFYLRRVYDGIPFDVLSEGKSQWGPIQDVPYYDTLRIDLANAMVIDSEGVDCSVDISRCASVQKGEAVTEVVPLSKVMRQLSDTLTGGTTFQVQSAEMIYGLPFEETADNTVYENEIEGRPVAGVQHYIPLWKITLVNDLDQEGYCYYFDAASGEMRGVREQ